MNLASVEGIEGGQSQTAYNASKGGVVLLTRSMAVDYGPDNVRVNCLCPGMIQTPMTAPLQDSGLRPVLEWFEAQHLLGRCRPARRGRGRARSSSPPTTRRSSPATRSPSTAATSPAAASPARCNA